DQTSLGQFSGRVQQTYKHSVPRFFVPEHGTMFTLALVRFPPTATKEIQYLNAKGALTYTDIAGDPVLYGNLPPREISIYVFMPPNLGGFFMVRSYYPSECHADYFDFERIEALKPAIEACGISTLSQSPML